ncbi:DUF397 domain-containing protein [Streptomyces sp. SA15]|uniref:DUF397 domain-containing protein n=1 Tax=Streptomyces sp. SA15 TaxID=934019 RepID=UPI000BAF8AD8|nr:DUF397 domain-containing protein [Streptomyces sp. SA15]PAZ11618.1 DUF397 domain-containing protein [Streptomyces sp. SA15]
MSELSWQKSSFSEGGAANCVEIATYSTGLAHLRESDEPTIVIETTATALGALLRTVTEGVTGIARG